jgi:colicin import membrane protein
MNATAQFPFQPPADNAGAARGFVLAVVVHSLLFAFLFFGIRWQSSKPVAPEADLWTALPPMSAPPAPRAAPPVPEPPKVEEKPQPVEPPPPAPPDIRIKEPEKKPPPKKAEQPKKIEPPKVEPPKAEPKKQEVKPLPPKPLPSANFSSEIDKELKKFNSTAMADAAGKDLENLRSGAAGRAARTWAEKVGSLVRSKVPVSVAEAVPGNPTATFEVTLLPGREVGPVKLLKSSGNPAYDEAAERAIKAVSPLPPFTDGMEPLRTFKLDARPKEQ